MIRRFGVVLVVGLFVLTSCGDDDIAVAVEIPDGATFCSVFDGEYTSALDDAVPITDDGFGESTARIVAWAEVLLTLAPDEIITQAEDNLRLHEAHAAVKSASDFIPGSNEMHAWAWDNCD